MLELSGVQAGYGSAKVLFDVSFGLEEGQVTTLLGRNGMGKTTTILTILGMLKARAGEIYFHGKRIDGEPSFRIAKKGIGIIPEGRQIFPTLSVDENLVATAAARFGAPRWTSESVFALFPRLKERRKNLGTQLSGGEQQMLAIGRALMTNPKLLIFDEATEGLAPLVRAEIWDCLRMLRSEGQSILIIDKNVDQLALLADRHVVIEKGRVVWNGDSAALMSDAAVKERFLHV